MINDTTAFPRTAAVQPGNSDGPVLDGAGTLHGVTVARMNDVAVMAATDSVPQSIQLRHQGRGRGELPAGERGRAEDERRDRAAAHAEDRAGREAFTAQVMCVRRVGPSSLPRVDPSCVQERGGLIRNGGCPYPAHLLTCCGSRKRSLL